MSGNVSYFFQPRVLDDEGQPVEHLYLEAERFDVKPEDFEVVPTPFFKILGTTVTDKASGFTGMAVAFIRHINGCFHVFIQPEGLNSKNKSPIQRRDFDLRSCEGEMIEQLPPEKLEESKKKTPSPAPFGSNSEPKLKNLFYKKWKSSSKKPTSP